MIDLVPLQLVQDNSFGVWLGFDVSLLSTTTTSNDSTPLGIEISIGLASGYSLASSWETDSSSWLNIIDQGCMLSPSHEAPLLSAVL